MIVVLPVCAKDHEAALRNLQWAIELDGKSALTCLVTHDTSFDASKVLELAVGYFAQVREYAYTPPRGSKWPEPQNVAFQQSASRIFASERRSWFWWEQDAVPLKAGWLESISKEHEVNHKLFTGAQSATEHGSHLNGVAVYPWNLPILCPDMMLCRQGPFDVVGGKTVLGQAHVTDLLQHTWSWDGRGNDSPAPSFRSKDDLAKLSKQAVLFHRCKDGSLIELLRGKPVEAPKPKERPSNGDVGLLQLLSMRKYGTGRFATRQSRPSIFTIFHRPTLWHCVERHKTPPAVHARIRRAWDSWVSLYTNGRMRPAHLWEPKRSAKDLGDKRDLPFLKDVLLSGMNRAGKHDVLVLTNDDTILHHELPDAVLSMLKGNQALASFRLNFPPGSPPNPAAPIYELIEKGAQDLGRDLFAFRKSWLVDNWNAIPDFLLGELEWDLVMSVMIRAAAGIQTTRDSLRVREPSCELNYGYVLHEAHDAPWKDKANTASPGKHHNLRLMRQWYADNSMPSMITVF